MRTLSSVSRTETPFARSLLLFVALTATAAIIAAAVCSFTRAKSLGRPWRRSGS